jgi:hypothetical protein
LYCQQIVSCQLKCDGNRLYSAAILNCTRTIGQRVFLVRVFAAVCCESATHKEPRTQLVSSQALEQRSHLAPLRLVPAATVQLSSQAGLHTRRLLPRQPSQQYVLRDFLVVMCPARSVAFWNVFKTSG